MDIYKVLPAALTFFAIDRDEVLRYMEAIRSTRQPKSKEIGIVRDGSGKVTKLRGELAFDGRKEEYFIDFVWSKTGTFQEVNVEIPAYDGSSTGSIKPLANKNLVVTVSGVGC